MIAAVLNGQGGFMNAISEMSQIPSDVAVTEGTAGSVYIFLRAGSAQSARRRHTDVSRNMGTAQMIGKFYAIKDEKSINTGTVISTLFAVVVSGGCYFLGGFARLFDSPQIYDTTSGAVVYDSIIPHMLSALPDILIGIVVVLVLSASMSTLSSLVLTSSSTMTLDLIKDNVVKNMSEKKQIITMQVLIVFFLVVSVVIALDPPTFIAQLMGISWGALAGAFLAPFMYGLYWKGVTRAGVWAGFIAGVGLTVANMFIGFIESPINAGAAAMVLGLVVVPVVSLISPKLDKKKVDEIFECYEEKVVISENGRCRSK